MLRSRIAKPRMIASDCPTVVMHDFLNHISVFEILPCSLYEWNPESDGQKGDCISLTDDIQTKLCDIRPESSLIESQRFDTLITQQWLRVSMWRLELGKMTRSLRNQGSPMISSVPFEAGKVVMKALGSFDQTSRDCNGIGIVSTNLSFISNDQGLLWDRNKSSSTSESAWLIVRSRLPHRCHRGRLGLETCFKPSSRLFLKSGDVSHISCLRCVSIPRRPSGAKTQLDTLACRGLFLKYPRYLRRIRATSSRKTSRLKLKDSQI